MQQSKITLCHSENNVAHDGATLRKPFLFCSGGDAGNDAEHAYHINTETSYQGFLKDDDHYDYYSFDSSAGQIISVTVASDHGGIKVILYGPDGRMEGDSSVLPGRPGRVEYVAKSTGTQIIKLELGSGTGDYTLTLDYQVLTPRFTYSYPEENEHRENEILLPLPSDVSSSSNETGFFVGDVITLDASSSSCESGEIKGYEWFITNKALDYHKSLTGRTVKWTPPCWGGLTPLS